MIERLREFLTESLKIEGIIRPPTSEEIHVSTLFLEKPLVDVGDMENIVSVFAPGALLRASKGMDVRVGSHYPPRGGENIRQMLEVVLKFAGVKNPDPFHTHKEYENLHPFTDGNGRSGRLLWLWQMWRLGEYPKSFLHKWYYQSL